MKQIVLISDTHSYLDPKIWKYLANVDEVWHAGDVGNLEVIDKIRDKKPLRGVYGNIDDNKIRQELPLDNIFEIEGLKIYMTHIGGYPGTIKPRAQKIIDKEKPDIYICGHSHICKVMRDQKNNLIHINPGAAGNHGFHPIKTIVRFELDKGKIDQLEVIELGKRGK
jgi:putative phosphoesterase